MSVGAAQNPYAMPSNAGGILRTTTTTTTTTQNNQKAPPQDPFFASQIPDPTGPPPDTSFGNYPQAGGWGMPELDDPLDNIPPPPIIRAPPLVNFEGRPLNPASNLTFNQTQTISSVKTGRQSSPAAPSNVGSSGLNTELGIRATEVDPNYRLISSKVNYDTALNQNANDLIRKSMPNANLIQPGTTSRIVKEETNETVNINQTQMANSPTQIQRSTLEDRNQKLILKTREHTAKIAELEEQLEQMTVEKDKIITDYEDYIDHLMGRKNQLKGYEGLVKKLQTEKEFLENELEKVNSIKQMLENQLNSYSDNPEIIRLRNENQRIKDDMKRIRTTIYTETGEEGDINSMDIVKSIRKYRQELVVIQNTNTAANNERIQLQRQVDELEDKLQFAKGDINAQAKTIRNEIEDYRQQLGKIQQIQGESKRTEEENKVQMMQRIAALETENRNLKSKVKSIKDGVRQTGAGGLEANHIEEINTLKSQIEVLRTQPPNEQEAEVIRGEVQRVLDRMERLNSRNQELEGILQQMQAAGQQGDRGSHILNNEVNALNNRLGATTQENSQLQQQLDQLMQEYQNQNRLYENAKRSNQ